MPSSLELFQGIQLETQFNWRILYLTFMPEKYPQINRHKKFGFVNLFLKGFKAHFH